MPGTFSDGATLRKGELVVPINAVPAFVPLVIEPWATEPAAVALADAEEIRIKICGVVLHQMSDCNPDRAAALVAALRKVL